MAGYGPMGALSPEEEEALLRAAAMKQKGMISQSSMSREDLMASANADFTGESDSIDMQRAIAAKMMGAKGKEGHMMGRVYAAPTWADNLATMGEKLVGGYKMGKAREAAKDLGLRQSRSAADKGKLADLRRGEEWTEQRGQNQIDIDAAIEAARVAREAKAAAALTVRTDAQAEADPGQFIDMNNVEAGPFQTEFSQGVGQVLAGTDTGVPDGSIPYSDYIDQVRAQNTGTGASSGYTKQDPPLGADDAGMGASIWSQLNRAENIYESTGAGFDSFWTAATGLAPWGEGGADIQETQRLANKAGFEGASADFARMKLGQISKNEFDTVMGANQNWKTEPKGTIKMTNDMVGLYGAALDRGIKAGTHTQAQKDEVINDMTDSMVISALRTNPSTGKPTMSMVELRELGVEPKDMMTRLHGKEGKTVKEKQTLLALAMAIQEDEEAL